MYLGAKDKSIAVAVITKVGSQSMIAAAHTFNAKSISAEEAMTYETVIAYLRHPITRVNSLFNNLWHVANYGGDVAMLPKGTIKGYGGRLKNESWPNPHHWTESKRVLVESDRDKLSRELTIEDKGKELNNADYRRYIDFIIDTGKDEHWQPQIEQLRYQGKIVPTTLYRFERDLESTWLTHFGGRLPRENSWGVVPIDSYRLPELESIYAEDLEYWGDL